MAKLAGGGPANRIRRSVEIKGDSAELSISVTLTADCIDEREIASLAHRAAVETLVAVKDVPLARQSARTLDDFINGGGNDE